METQTVADATVDVPWGAVWGQDEAVRALQEAVADPASMTHAWLITGPPGSGRSTLAYAFAAALIAEPGDEAAMRQVLARTHPDLTSLRTEQVIIRIDEARKLVERAYFAPSVGRHRVIIVEDADRMAERTSNVLLKALEEPPERTVWVLCAPSDADLLPTIRSRVRTLRLNPRPPRRATTTPCPVTSPDGPGAAAMRVGGGSGAGKLPSSRLGCMIWPESGTMTGGRAPVRADADRGQGRHGRGEVPAR